MSARLKLNFFSPLPPVHSDIANFTRLVVTELQALADVTVWTAQPETPELAAPVAIQRFDPEQMSWPLLQQADLNVYNLGNNANFHRAIFDVARQAPGLIVLHDTRLQHFFARYSETPGPDREFYLESIRRWYGQDGLANAHAFLEGKQKLDHLVDRYPMTLAALEGSLGAVLHNEADRQALAEQTRTPLFYLPLAYAGPGAAERRMPGGTLRLIVFGFIGANRRLNSILEALAGHADTDIELNIYGALEDPAAVEAQIAALGLQERVRQHGFVPEAELTAALAYADLALNLRFPTMGEASGSQLRIWDSGLSSLVTRVGWYAALPEDAVFFVEPDREVEVIRTHLTALRTDPARFRRAGQRGREILLARHAPAAYAGGLMKIARQAKALHARRQAISLSHVAAHKLLDIADLAGIGLCADSVAEAVHALTQPAAPA
jgi:glycosyltransferase involved in cell wall biosynthesis